MREASELPHTCKIKNSLIEKRQHGPVHAYICDNCGMKLLLDERHYSKKQWAEFVRTRVAKGDTHASTL